MVVINGYRRSCEYDIPHHDQYNSEMPHNHCDKKCGERAYHPFLYTPTPNLPVAENLFLINGTTPLLMDHTQYRYGPMISAGNDIETRLVNRKGVACVNIDATFDLTEKITTNAAWERYLEQLISMKYEEIDEVLSMVKSTITFRMYYTVKDTTGATVVSVYCDSPCQCGFLHPVGDVKDYFVTSYKNIFTDMLSSVPYSGLYTITIDKIEAVIDTCKIHDLIPSGGINTYYAFSHNNTQIDVYHEAVNPISTTTTAVIATCEVGQTFTFETNTTTKIKVSYTAFMNSAIIVPNTLGIWNSLFDPSDVIIKDLKDRVEELEEDVEVLQTQLEQLDAKPKLIKYAKNTVLHAGDLTWNVLGTLYQVAETYTTTSSTAVTVAEAFASDITDGKLLSIIPTTTDDDTSDTTPTT